MKTEYFVTVKSNTKNGSDGSTMGPYISREECKQFIKEHNKKMFINPSVTFISDDSITYQSNNIKINYSIVKKSIV